MIRNELICVTVLIEGLGFVTLLGFVTSEWNPYVVYSFVAVGLHILPAAYFYKYRETLRGTSAERFTAVWFLHLLIFGLFGLLLFFSIDPEERIPDTETIETLLAVFAGLRLLQTWCLTLPCPPD